jgi:hypothetical protein
MENKTSEKDIQNMKWVDSIGEKLIDRVIMKQNGIVIFDSKKEEEYRKIFTEITKKEKDSK